MGGAWREEARHDRTLLLIQANREAVKEGFLEGVMAHLLSPGATGASVSNNSCGRAATDPSDMHRPSRKRRGLPQNSWFDYKDRIDYNL